LDSNANGRALKASLSFQGDYHTFQKNDELESRCAATVQRLATPELLYVRLIAWAGRKSCGEHSSRKLMVPPYREQSHPEPAHYLEIGSKHRSTRGWRICTAGVSREPAGNSTSLPGTR